VARLLVERDGAGRGFLGFLRLGHRRSITAGPLKNSVSG
jgi:hypothetical protein